MVSRSVVYIILVVIVIVGILISLLFGRVRDVMKPEYHNAELLHPDGKHKIFIKSEIRGMRGGEQTTFITTDITYDFELDTARQMIFEGLAPFSYKLDGDTLKLLVKQPVRVPPHFNKRWVVVQHTLPPALPSGYKTP